MAQTPIYEERDCPLCKERDAANRKGKLHVCADCGQPIPTEATDYAYKNMGNQGFQSHTSDHRHTKVVLGVMGFSNAKRELCLGCYRIDWKKVYPEEPLPV